MGYTSKEEHAALIREVQNGDEKAFTKIYQQFKPLVISCVNKLIDQNCDHLREELESVADEALWNAVKTFDLERGFLFTTYATSCINHAIQRQMRKYCKERQHIKEYSHETFEFVVDPNSDEDDEIAITDPFPCHDEPPLPKLTPFCKTKKESTIIELICNNEDVCHKNGKLNNAAIGRKLEISRQAVGRIIANLRTNQLLKSTICELVPH